MSATIQKALVVILSAVFIQEMSAQLPDHVSGDILIQVAEQFDHKQAEAYINSRVGILPEFRMEECISSDMHIWRCTFNPEAIQEKEMLHLVRETPGILIAQFNHILEERLIPDDPFFSQQWHLQDAEDNDVDAELAWDITTGGNTVNGDEIVVCVVELDGAKWDVSEIVENHWVNNGEIESNGVDDDGNGYVDDYHGWNAALNNDDIDPGNHGTQVCSMIGAKGNNTEGISGVNWDVKMMLVEIGGANEAGAIAGYSYPLKMRKLYNQTGGVEGAFVVVTNSSWGVNYGQPNDAPLWCAMYDSLGTYGVLSCGSTTNSNVDVDANGDLPTACPSDFLVSVGRTNSQDVRASGGYGLTTIDLMAPGDAVYLANNNGYATTTGTSFSGPCVAGAIALLYSAPCNSLMQMVNYSPAEAALDVKSYIMEGVDQTNQLLQETVSGGRLNIRNSLDLLLLNCDNNACIAPFGLNATQIKQSLDYMLAWDQLPGMNSFTLRYRMIGTDEWTEIADVPSNAYMVSGLTACTSYEFQVMADCDQESSNWTASYEWTSDGCCVNPESISVLNTTESTASIAWNDILAADSYTLLFSDPLGNELTFENIFENPYTADSLVNCTEYTISVISSCPDNQDEIPSVDFHTSGCDDCSDLQYCTVGSDSDAEHIAHVQLGDINRNSGSDNGYILVEDQTTILHAGSTYNITCAPGYAGTAYNENFRAWIDYNSDGQFNELTELVFDSPNPGTTSVTQSFTVPLSISPGVVRFRVAMTYSPPSNPAEPSPCGSWQYGEIEDYCVTLDATIGLQEDDVLGGIRLFPNPTDNYLLLQTSTEIQQPMKIEIVSLQGQVVKEVNANAGQPIDVQTLSPGLYILRARSNQHVFTLPFVRQ